MFNLKQMAQTINFLTENDITDYETLVEKTKAATDRYHELSQQIKKIEKRMAEIIELKMHIINYAKTKDVFVEYQKSGYSTNFYEENVENLLIHQSAKQTIIKVGINGIPTFKNLQKELMFCIFRLHPATCTEKSCHSAGKNLPRYRISLPVITNIGKM